MWPNLTFILDRICPGRSDECLNVGVFFTLEHVREKLLRWQQDYNLVRPHSALEGQAPASFVAGWIAATTPTGQESHELLETLT
jgi:transposase InsO family protein